MSIAARDDYYEKEGRPAGARKEIKREPADAAPVGQRSGTSSEVCICCCRFFFHSCE